jgi:hypothetical protein
VNEKNGGQGRNRTADASLFRAALYRLSYLAIRVGYMRASSVGPLKTLCIRNGIDYNNDAEFTQTAMTAAPGRKFQKPQNRNPPPVQ